MPHPNSLANLKRGNPNKGFKKELTKIIQADMVDLIQSDYPEFCRRMRELKDKDYVDAYLAIMKLVMPKQLDVSVDDSAATMDWAIIEFVSPEDKPQNKPE